MSTINGKAPEPWPSGSQRCQMPPTQETSMHASNRSARQFAALALAIGLSGSVTISVLRAAEPVAVKVINASEPTLCAETDNVYVKLVSPSVEQFIVEASHPAYARTIVADNAAADFRD